MSSTFITMEKINPLKSCWVDECGMNTKEQFQEQFQQFQE